MKIEFNKYQGAGNDFVVIDNRDLWFDDKNEKLVEYLCHRRFGVGSDGLMLLQNSDEYDFEMRYYNSDGAEASMCGNGGRCIVAFAKHLGVIENETTFLAVDGVHKAIIEKDGRVNLEMTNVHDIEKHWDGYFLNTGSPHMVKFVDDLSKVDIAIEGRQLRYDSRFQPAGTNANFVKEDNNHLTVYTYERGVEQETLACGTGITAAALSAAFKNNLTKGNYDVTAKGGQLHVSYEREGNSFTNVWLKGPATRVFEGKIEIPDLE